MEIETIKPTTITKNIKLSNFDILHLLINAGHISSEYMNATVIFSVPGGGDYSNMDLDVDVDCPIKVCVEEEK